jgi:3-hydroxyisobutyrate dehydrogenase-like beta-hydroxyacid dehydrogenase
MALTGIGLAGCGRMGEPMLRAMRALGFDAQGFDIRAPETYGDLADAVTDCVQDFSQNLRILLTVVRDITQTEHLLFTDQNLIDRAGQIETIVICSTLSPRYVRALRARVPANIRLIDAPMSGARIAAEERRLSFMQGGDIDDITAIQPLFSAMGSSFHHMGTFGSGMAAKVLNNLLAASNTVMTRMVLDWAESLELDEVKLLALIDKSSGQNWFASNFHQIEFARDGYTPENTIGILKKDVLSALDAAPSGADTRLPHLLASLIEDLPSKP